MARLCYLSVILICGLAMTIGITHTVALSANSSQTTCLQIGDKLLEIQSGQIVRVPAESYVRALGANVYAVYPSPTRHDTVIVYQAKDGRYGIALLANNRIWVDVQSNKVQQALVEWSRDGQYFSYGDNTTRAILYDVQARKATSIDGFWYTSWPLDGGYLSLRAKTPDGANRIWSVHESGFVEPANALTNGLFTLLSSANSILYITRTGALRLLRLDTHTDQKLLQFDSFPTTLSDVANVSVSANGKYISIERGDAIDVFSIDGNLVKVLKHTRSKTNPVTWMENRLLILSSDAGSFSLTSYDPEADQIYSLATDVIPMPDEVFFYETNGDYVAYAQTSEHGMYLWAVQTDGSHRVRSQTELPATTTYFWLGHSLYLHDTTQPYTATWMDTNTGDIHRLPQDPRDTNRDDAADIAGQGNLAFWANNSPPGSNFLYLLNPDKGTQKTLFLNNRNAQMSWSRDGSFITAYIATENRVIVFDTDGQQRAIFNATATEFVWTLCN